MDKIVSKIATKVFIHDEAGPKSEARNPKFETISNDQIPMFETKGFGKFGFRKFGFVLRQAQDGEQSRTISDFGMRISDF
jgi:hypothetical protein